MIYCLESDKPIIIYKFGENPERRFKSSFAPISIETKLSKIAAGDNYNSQGFQVRFYSPNNFLYTDYIVTEYKIVDIGEAYNYDEILLKQCGETTLSANGPGIDVSTLVINPNIKCPVPEIDRCSFIVRHEDQIIFQDQGDCPLSLEVQCGNCPPHNIECKANHYPGYCCIPCESTAQKIHNLANKIK
ncbi:MAG: hypothetical protein HC787_11005 [Nostocaceae cyanobacterium CSU_2_110]|nr:hypothetical protein [Richelia sp. SM1_7_0]NJS17168.1 hypothetical protein [Nostocaceae cyanobacterium CSU_2_110]